MEIKVIKTEEEHEDALVEFETLLNANPPAGTSEADRLELLAVLIRDYEDEHYPVPSPDPIEAIKFRMEQEGLTRKDLEAYIGSSKEKNLTLRLFCIYFILTATMPAFASASLPLLSNPGSTGVAAGLEIKQFHNAGGMYAIQPFQPTGATFQQEVIRQKAVPKKAVQKKALCQEEASRHHRPSAPGGVSQPQAPLRPVGG